MWDRTNDEEKNSFRTVFKNHSKALDTDSPDIA